jgi:3',5'-nucleoside bisphosphate phosphatase
VRPPVDLHIHSTFSDGTCTVDEICALAQSAGMRTIALSDHDTANGLKPLTAALQAAAKGIRLIPAIEMSSGQNGLAHVLGYGAGVQKKPLQDELAALRRKRIARTRRTIEVLNRLTGETLSEAFLDQANDRDHAAGRVHVARQLVERKIVGSVEEAFAKYIGLGKPAFIPLEHISTEDAVGVLRGSGAVPALAHPMRTGLRGGELENYVVRLKDMGLMGLEAFHPSASEENAQWLYGLARRLKLMVTGGSDFHGDRSMHTRIGEYPSGWMTWQQDLDDLSAAISESDA